MNVQVLGPGCARCRQLFAQAEEAIARSGVQASLEKVERIDLILEAGVLITPALAIDGVVKCSGRIAAVPEIISWLTPSPAKNG